MLLRLPLSLPLLLLVVPLMLASGCVVEERDRGGFGERLPGGGGIEVSGGAGDAGRAAGTLADGAVVTPAEAFAPLPELAAGRGSADVVRLDAAPPRPGDVYAVDVTVAVEIALRDLAAGTAAMPRFSLADLRSQGSAVFTGLTTGRLRGRLLVDEIDGDGRVSRAMFETSDATLVRDGELLARVPAARTVRLLRDPAGRLSVVMAGESLGGFATQLFEMCLFTPLETVAWDEAASTAQAEPRQPGEAWPVDPDAVGQFLGLAPGAGISPQRRGIARRLANAPTPSPTISTVVEVRVQADRVADERIIGAFGPSLVELPDAAAVHRIGGSTPNVSSAAADAAATAALHDRIRSSIVVHRFRLLDRRGPLEGQRVERQDISILPLRPGPAARLRSPRGARSS